MNPDNGNSNFKTFVVIAALVAVFGSLVYSSKNVDSLDKKEAAAPTYKKTSAEAPKQAENPNTATTNQPSPFKELAMKKAEGQEQEPAVLQAATETDGTMVSGTDATGGVSSPVTPLAAGAGPQTTTSVPQTGNSTMTVALILSSAALAFGFYVVSRNPRKKALAKFEKRVTKKL